MVIIIIQNDKGQPQVKIEVILPEGSDEHDFLNPIEQLLEEEEYKVCAGACGRWLQAQDSVWIDGKGFCMRCDPYQE